jgi:hypothetical protein
MKMLVVAAALPRRWAGARANTKAKIDGVSNAAPCPIRMAAVMRPAGRRATPRLNSPTVATRGAMLLAPSATSGLAARTLLRTRSR